MYDASGGSILERSMKGSKIISSSELGDWRSGEFAREAWDWGWSAATTKTVTLKLCW